MREAGDLGQVALQPPHQLERPLSAVGALQRMELGVARQSGDSLVELGVVLHRAGPERIEAGVEVEVALREPVEVAHDLGFGDLGQLRGPFAAEPRFEQLVERALGNVERWGDERAAARLGAIEDRQLVIGSGNHARDSLIVAFALRRHSLPERGHQRIDLGPGSALGDRDQQPVAVLGVVASEWVARVDSALQAALDHALRRVRRAPAQTRAPPAGRAAA